MKTAAKPFSSWALSAAAIAVCIYVFYEDCVWALYTNQDAGWLIQTGQYILNHGLPKEDPFSWTNPHCALVCYQWLFEVAVAELFRFGSIWLVGFVTCLLAGLLMLFILPRIWTNAGIPPFVPFTVMALVQTPNWFQARPQLISYYLCLSFILLLERFRRTGHWLWLLPLPLLTALWVNVHLLWTFGLLVLSIYLVCQWRRANQFPLALAAALIASALAVLCNPYGLGIIGYAFSFVNGSQYSHIWELQPAWSTMDGAWSALLLPAAAALLWWRRRQLPAEAFIIGAITVAAAIVVRRFQPLAIISCWTFVGAALSTVDWSRLAMPAASTSHARRIITAVCACMAALIVSACCWYWRMPNFTTAWMVFTEDSFPLLCALQKVLTVDDRLFNNPSIGSWLIATQQTPVFVDTRFDMYPRPFLETMESALNASGNWQEVLDEYCIDQVVVRDNDPLNQRLMTTPNWVIVLHDGHFAWWMHNSEKNYATMHHWSLSDDLLTQSKLPSWIIDTTVETRAARYLLLARNFRKERKYELATDAAHRGLMLMPESKSLHRELSMSSNGSPN